MSVYSVSKIPLETASTVAVTHWHPTIPVVAVAATSGRVTIYSDDGEKVFAFKRGEPCISLQWHPRLALLLCGWRDGVVTCAALDTQSNREIGPTHESNEVSVILWTPNGQYAMSADKGGAVAVWRCDSMGSVSLMFVHRKEGAIRTGVCLTSPPKHSTPTPVGEIAGDSGDAEQQLTEDGEVPSRRNMDLSIVDEDSPTMPEAAFAFACGSAIEAFDENGNGAHLAEIEGSVASMLWVPHKNSLIVLTSSLQVYHYNVSPDLQAEFLFKMKISGSTSEPNVVAGVHAAGMLVTSCGEQQLRLWNLEEQDMYALSLPPQEEVPGAVDPAADVRPSITAVAFNPTKGALAVGTKSGRVVVWQYCGAGAMSTREEDWDVVASVDTNQAVANLQWGVDDAMCVTSADNVSILIEVQLKRKLSSKASVCQNGIDSFFVQTTQNNVVIPAKTASGGRIRGLDVMYPNVCIWTGKKIELFQINESTQTANTMSSMNETATLVALAWNGVFVARPNKIELYTFQFQLTGTPLPINESEGEPVVMDTCEEFLAVATDRGQLRVWRVGREVKLLGTPRHVIDEPKVEITAIRVNARGKKVAMLTKMQDEAGFWVPDTRVWVYDLDVDRSMTFDFSPFSRIPTFLSWTVRGGDSTVDVEHTILCCETSRIKSGEDDVVGAPTPTMMTSSGFNNNNTKADSLGTRAAVSVLYANPEHGIVSQSNLPVPAYATCFLGLSVPQLHFYCKKKLTQATTPSVPRETHVYGIRMHDLEGINLDSDIKVREAMLKFSYNLSIGNMDEAYRAVKSVKDESVWSSMATMCVKTHRLDVAEVCLGNIQDPMASKLLRSSYGEAEIEARVAMLALVLGQPDEAERLYRECGRYDLLNKMFQTLGRYDDAIAIAEKYDRIHLKATHFAKAQHLERNGDIDAAVRSYRDSGCHRVEVPRMMFEHRRLHELESFVVSTKDTALFAWWAQYLESTGNTELSGKYYEAAKDTLSRVRLLCSANPPKLDEALELVQSTSTTPGGRAAAYHLARFYEDQRNVQQAIDLFCVAGALKHCIRIARESDLVGEVMTQSLKSNDPSVLLDSASYFEERGLLDKAVTLYHKGGDLRKALETCIQARLFDTLQSIAETLDSSADPDVFQVCADFFVSHGQFDKAVGMLTQAKAYTEALQLCLERGVKLTEELAEAMTLPKTDNEQDEEFRIAQLKKIAKVAKMQESWHLACQKYSQAGDRVKAMKMLLRSGDVDKIIFYANHARSKDIYVLAANFLQSCEWHCDPKSDPAKKKKSEHIYKHILLFYNKAHAYDRLAIFYDTCSQLQIDEHRDYASAAATLRESIKCMEKMAQQVPQDRIDLLRLRLSFIEKYAQACRIDTQGPTASQGSDMVSICQDLLNRFHPDHPEHEALMSAIRVGDVYGLLVGHYYKQQQWESAYEMIQRMVEAQIELTYYLDESVVQKIYSSMGMQYVPQKVSVVSPTRREDEVDEEDIPDDDD